MLPYARAEFGVLRLLAAGVAEVSEVVVKGGDRQRGPCAPARSHQYQAASRTQCSGPATSFVALQEEKARGSYGAKQEYEAWLSSLCSKGGHQLQMLLRRQSPGP